MHPRRIIYVAVLAAVALALYYAGIGQDDQQMQKYIPTAVLLQDFTEVESHPELAGYLPAEGPAVVEAHFPASFKGWEGEVFYIYLQADDQFSLHKYEIVLDAENERLSYQHRESWDGLRPPQNKFTVYQLRQGEWVKAE